MAKDATYKAVANAPADDKGKRSFAKGDTVSQAEYEKLDSREQGLFVDGNADTGYHYGDKTPADDANAAGSLLVHDAVPNLDGGLKENLVPVKDDASGNVHFENFKAKGNEDLIPPKQQPTANDIAATTEPLK